MLSQAPVANLAATILFIFGVAVWAANMTLTTNSSATQLQQLSTKLHTYMLALDTKLDTNMQALRKDAHDGKTRAAVITSVLGTLVSCGALALIASAAGGFGRG